MRAFGKSRRPEPAAPAPRYPRLDALEPRVRVRAKGQVFRIKSRPTDGMPSLEVTLVDETGRVTVIWSGRRSIGGIGLGRMLVVDGVPVQTPSGLTFTNPAYELL